MSGGGESKAAKYAKFGAGKYGSSDFERYVDSKGDLAAAWNKIESDPTAWDSEYWIKRGATSKAAFGRAHAAEDAELYAGTYGAGGTKVVPGSAEYDAYFGDSGGTRFNEFTATPTSADSGGGGGGGGTPDVTHPWDDPTNKTNVYHPMLVPEYSDPQAQDWSQYMPQGQSGLLYQPWSQEYGEQFVQPNIWDYQPPELTVGRPEYSQNPLGLLEVTDYVPPSESTTNPNDDLENRGGPDPNYDNDPNRPPQSGFIIGADGKGYAVDENGMVIGPSGYPSIDLTAKHNPQTNNPTLADLLAGLGLGSGGTSGGTSGGSGNSPGPGGPAGGGHSNK